MEKLTTILLIVDGVDTGMTVLDKTVALARRFRARVDLVVAERGSTAAFAARCTERGYDEVLLCSVFQGGEPMSAVAMRRVLDRNPDLVVKARSKSNDDQWLIAHCPAPLVLMGERPWRSPIRVAAAVDVSSEEAALARGIVDVAGFLCLGVEGELDVLYSEREQEDEVLRMSRAVKLARLVREFHVGGERMRRFEGAPEESLPRVAASGQYDLLVLGAVSHRKEFSWLLGTLTRKLVDTFDGDVVLVRDEAAIARQQRGRGLSSPARS